MAHTRSGQGTRRPRWADYEEEEEKGTQEEWETEREREEEVKRGRAGGDDRRKTVRFRSVCGERTRDGQVREGQHSKERERPKKKNREGCRKREERRAQEAREEQRKAQEARERQVRSLRKCEAGK